MDIIEKSWRSSSLNKEMTIRVFGEDGTPVLVFPNRNGTRGSWEKFGMIEAISFQLENRHNQLYCVDTVDQESFFNPDIEPKTRLGLYARYETYIINEVIPFIVKNSGNDFIIVAGVELGGLYSMNMVLKYPNEFGKIITMGAILDLDVVLHADDVELMYYHNPIAYMPNLTDVRYLDAIRKLDIRIAVNANDPMFDQNLRFSEILNRKAVPHVFDVWDEAAVYDWTGYRDMVVKHIV
jgi:esterase/lipase superfamily enzyme